MSDHRSQRDGHATFVDTGGWIGITNPRDTYGPQAQQIFERLLREDTALLTTNLVIAETYEALRRGRGARRALAFLDLTFGHPRLEIVYSTPDSEAAARQILRQYHDQDFSYVDAVSFALMRARRLTTAFAFDHHFLVAGFQLLSATP